MQNVIKSYQPEFRMALSIADFERASTIAMFVAGELLKGVADVNDELRLTLWREFFSHLDRRWSGQYQSYDFEIVDYKMYSILPGGVLFRGPRPQMSRVAAGQYYTFCGTSQLFGRFHSSALHSMVAKELDCDSVNLSIGGVGPQVFSRDWLLSIVNGSMGVVLPGVVRAEHWL